MNKEIEDALNMLLHCSLKDTEYETQVEQYKIVRNYITNLQQENQKYKEVINKLKNKTKENIENAKCEITTLTTGDKAYYQYIEKILDNYVDILKEVE